MARKTRPQDQAAQPPRSRALRAAMIGLQSRQPEQGLRDLNTLAQTTRDAAGQARILGLVGDYELRRGKHREAVAAFHGGLAAAGADTRLVYRLRSGVVRALLAYGKPDLARAQAQATVVALRQAEQDYRSALAAAERDLVAGGVAQVSPRPFYASQAAARLGRLFLDAGDPSAAEPLLMESLRLHPRGSPDVFTHLAHLAARTGRWDQAEALAARALDLGGLKSATLEAWQLAITTRQRRNEPGLDPHHEALLQAAQPAIRARAILWAVQILRGAGDPAWQALAERWLEQEGGAHPVVAVEIRKLLLCEQAVIGTRPDDMARHASRILATDALKPHEFMAAFRRQVLGALQQGQTLDLAPMVAAGAARFGAGFRARLLNTAANVHREHRQWNPARELYAAALAGLPPAGYWHCRIGWNLAGLLVEMRQPDAAARQYLDLARDPAAPAALRVNARVRVVDLVNHGAKVDVAALRRELEQALDAMDDYEAVLTLARDVHYSADPSLAELGRCALAKGQRLARQVWGEATEPAVAARVLFRFARRLLDMQQNADMADLWDNLPPAKRAWLRAAGRDYWDFMALYYRALCRLGRSAEARRLAEPILADPATPDVGRLALGLAHGLQLVKTRASRPEGLDVLRRLPHEGTLQPDVAAAAYWLALDAWQRGERQAVRDHALHMKRCLGVSPGLKRHQQLLLCAELLLADLQADAVVGRYRFATRSSLADALARMRGEAPP